MYESAQLSIPKRAEDLFKIMLFLYPKKYRKRFGHEMFLVFQDMYYEELEKHGKVGVFFWTSQIVDMTKSILDEHKNLIIKKGMKKYLQQSLHINKSNIVGALLLLPFLTLLGIDFLGRLVQGDLMHYNMTWYSVMSHTILYSTFNGHAYLLWIVFIAAPIIALALNVIPVIKYLHPRKKITLKTLLFTNPIAIAIIGIAFFALLIVYGHDFFPCIVHGLLNGAVNKENIIAVCKNA